MLVMTLGEMQIPVEGAAELASNRIAMNDSSARLNVTLDTSQPRQALEELGTLVQATKTGPLHGKPLFTIATLLVVAAQVLTALVAAILLLAGALPHGLEAQAANIVQYSTIGGAIALGLGGFGKSLYAIATAYQSGQLQMLPEATLLEQPPAQPTVVQHIVVRPDTEPSDPNRTDAAPPRGD